ncbi:hypothetical protein PTKIN_Ptkin01aG0107800 [Pterospermum kingtungense]
MRWLGLVVAGVVDPWLGGGAARGLRGELSGEKNWDGLLHPLDIDLRRYLIHYGQRTAAVGDLFNSEKESSGFQRSLYPKEEFFSRAGLAKGNIFKYNVTDLFYAASDDVDSAWFGYVAVTTDQGKSVLGRRDILFACRGTITDIEWWNNARLFPIPASELFRAGDDANVHSGFLSLYTGTSSKSFYNQTSAREQVLKEVKELVDKYQDEEISITVTGYSLGAALATLNAMDIVANGYNKPTEYSEKSCMVTAFVYASPRVGNSGLEQVFNTLGDHLHLLRITNANDIIPLLPLSSSYTHLGEELKVDSSKSPYLKPQVFADPSKIDPTYRGNIEFTPHNLDVYLHGVAGVQEDGFDLAVDHDIALVNRGLDILKDEYKIPPRWWENEYRNNMVQMDSGHWKFVQNA